MQSPGHVGKHHVFDSLPLRDAFAALYRCREPPTDVMVFAEVASALRSDGCPGKFRQPGKLAAKEGPRRRPLRQAVQVPHPSRVQSASILVFDDVFTDGLKTREVARALLAAGARDVSQVILARHLCGGKAHGVGDE